MAKKKTPCTGLAVVHGEALRRVAHPKMRRKKPLLFCGSGFGLGVSPLAGAAAGLTSWVRRRLLRRSRNSGSVPQARSRKADRSVGSPNDAATLKIVSSFGEIRGLAGDAGAATGGVAGRGLMNGFTGAEITKAAPYGKARHSRKLELVA